MKEITTDLGLEGKHVFIAGGSRGIGAATAALLGRLGAKVSLTYHQSKERAAELVQQIEADGGTAQALSMAIEEEASVMQAVDRAVQTHGELHGMVVSAGVFEHCPIEEMSPDFWRRTMTINLDGTFWCLKAAAKHMRAHGRGGSVVIYTSTAGQSGAGGGASAYAVSKAGQITFARCMAHELGPDGVRVNSLAPAWTETDMAAPHLEKLGRDKIAANFSLGRIGVPEDVAGATCYLLSDWARFVSGTVHTVDGGMAMRG